MDIIPSYTSQLAGSKMIGTAPINNLRVTECRIRCNNGHLKSKLLISRASTSLSKIFQWSLGMSSLDSKPTFYAVCFCCTMILWDVQCQNFTSLVRRDATTKTSQFLVDHLRGSLTIQTTPGNQLKNKSPYNSAKQGSKFSNGTTPPSRNAPNSQYFQPEGSTLSNLSLPVDAACFCPSYAVGSSSDGLKSIHKELGASVPRYTSWLER